MGAARRSGDDGNMRQQRSVGEEAVAASRSAKALSRRWRMQGQPRVCGGGGGGRGQRPAAAAEAGMAGAEEAGAMQGREAGANEGRGGVGERIRWEVGC